MIAHLMVIGLLWSAQSANLNSARQNYTGCLGILLRASLKERVPSGAFESTLDQACKAEEAAYRLASITHAVTVGTSRAVAEQNAEFEIAEIIDNTKQRYRDYRETNTEPR